MNFLETIFHIAPDAGNGQIEMVMLVALVLGAIVAIAKLFAAAK